MTTESPNQNLLITGNSCSFFNNMFAYSLSPSPQRSAGKAAAPNMDPVKFLDSASENSYTHAHTHACMHTHTHSFCYNLHILLVYVQFLNKGHVNDKQNKQTIDNSDFFHDIMLIRNIKQSW